MADRVSFSTSCLLPSFTNGNHNHSPFAVESLLPLRFSQASPDDQHIESHHRDHAECNYVFHFVYLICVTSKARRPQRRAAASALQDKPDGPSGRTGNRVRRSWDQYRLCLLSECDAHCQPPADPPAWERHNTHRNIRSLSEPYLFS